MVEAQVPRADAREIAPDIPSGLEPGLRNYWHPILRIEELPSERPVLGQREAEFETRHIGVSSTVSCASLQRSDGSVFRRAPFLISRQHKIARRFVDA